MSTTCDPTEPEVTERLSEVLADAATMIEIIEIVRSHGLKASIVRAPREDGPALVGLG